MGPGRPRSRNSHSTAHTSPASVPKARSSSFLPLRYQASSGGLATCTSRTKTASVSLQPFPSRSGVSLQSRRLPVRASRTRTGHPADALERCTTVRPRGNPRLPWHGRIIARLPSGTTRSPSTFLDGNYLVASQAHKGGPSRISSSVAVSKEASASKNLITFS